MICLFYNTEKHLKHINYKSKLSMRYACYRLWANHTLKNIGPFYTRNESL